jgi:hypothetical protein
MTPSSSSSAPQAGVINDPIIDPLVMQQSQQPGPVVPGMNPGMYGHTPENPLMPGVSQANPAIQSLFGNVLPPVQPPSWHEQAQSQADMLTPTPQNIATGESLFGQAVPTSPMFGDFDIGATVGQAPLVLQSRVPGLTPELDEIARREMMQELGAA